jgi:autotransporter-associated beta strand protein
MCQLCRFRNRGCRTISGPNGATPIDIWIQTYHELLCNSFNTKARKHGGVMLYRRLLAAILLLAGSSRSHATQLIWDPLHNGGVTPSGTNWDTSAGNTSWYNGSANIVWSQTSTTVPLNGATFAGADGTWGITNDSGQIAVNNLTVNNSGYAYYGSPIFLANTDFIQVADGKSATFNCNLSGSGNGAQYWTLGTGSSMVVNGNISTGGTGVQVRMAGLANSAYYLSGANTVAIIYCLAPVFLTNGSITASSSFFVGYQQTLPAPNSTTYASGSITIGTPTTPASITVNGQVLFIARAGGVGTVNLVNGTANVGVTAAHDLAVNYDGAANSSGTLNVYGGTLTVGSSTVASKIDFFDTVGAASGATGTMTQTNGTVFAWGGIQFGLASGSFSGGTAALTNSGGFLYVGQNGINRGAAFPPSIGIALSGGTVGALANWSSTLPMSLGTANGNITFQCADNSSNPFNISLSGALTGPGGLNVSGSGTLTLSGANNYAGSTVISNGTLAITTSASPTNGPVTLDGSAGSPAVSVTSSPGQYWAIGPLTFVSGSPSARYNFGALSPSTTIASVQVTGNLDFTASPAVTISGTAISVGTYPLIKYTGSVSGTLPANLSLPGYISAGYITNITGTKTIALVVTSSTYNPALSWRVGSGVWDINTTSNWTQFGSAAKYTDGNAVIFDDSASGLSPITVTLNTTVNPLTVTANNSTNKNYTITGTGTIAGSAGLSVLGTGSLTLTGTNSYSGGTTVSAGQLNINGGGDPVNGSPVGLGTLTLNAGAAIDNTSGLDITLQASVPETWNGNFTFAGGGHNLNTGPGSVTMGNSVSITVNSNTLAVGGGISDGGNNYTLNKTGNGALTLPVGNFFAGGLTLFSGTLNFGDPSAAGSGVFTVAGGAIDNVSGADLTLTPASYVWSGSFSVLGTGNLDLGFQTIVDSSAPLTVNVVSNTFTTEGNLTTGNNIITKTGNGTWVMGGGSTSANQLQLAVNQGEVDFARTSGQSIGLGTSGLTVRSNALVRDIHGFQVHSDTLITPVPVTLAGGLWDLNGNSENVDKLFISTGGVLRNGASASTSTFTAISGYTAMLTGPNCQFDVTAVDGILNFNGAIGGSGSLVKTGLGLLNLETSNDYTGDTTVSAGTLELAFPSLASASTVTIASNAVLQLDFPSTNVVGALVLNGVSEAAGVYNNASNPAYFTGTGSLLVVPVIPSSPTNITYSVSGSTLSVGWPSSYTGWILQTNAVSLVNSNSWHDVPGSSGTNQLSFPMSSAGITNEFFRLRHP